jgi:AraC-like DNA-binding protein
VVSLNADEMRHLSVVADQMTAELRDHQQPDQDLLLSYLKAFLIHASRVKMEQGQDGQVRVSKTPLTLENLRDAIDTNFRTLHSPGDYGDLLNISTKALNKASKAHFNKTLSDLIAERRIIEAKRELYLTSKAVKEIAFELGYEDEFYFSRYFKKKVGVSPRIFRDKVGFDKAYLQGDPKK